jgi:dTDP-4-amino-4,6-dideoxygalactose transaminase
VFFSDFSNEGLKVAYYSRGRDALWSALELLGLGREDIILIPSYICSAVIQPFKKKRLSFEIYDIKRDLSINFQDLREKICPKTKAILIIHYFGFPQSMYEIIEVCKKYNLLLIEDCAHVLMSKYNGKYVGTFGDASIFSFKKTLPDLLGRGAALLINNNNMHLNHFQYTDSALYRPNINIPKFLYRRIQYFILQYKVCRYYIDKIIGLTDFIRLRPNSHINSQYLNKLQRLDTLSLIAEYRDNFALLLENIIDCKNLRPVFNSLPTDVCPLGFPIFANNRDALFRKLLKNGIRPHILWEFLPKEINKQVFKDADYISKCILILPINNFVNVKKICKIIKS